MAEMRLQLRDYRLTGPNGDLAVERGLTSAEWYYPDVSRKDLRALMKRRDYPAIRDTAIWLGSMILLAGMGIYLWPSWWSAPFWLAYGVLYASSGDSRWHETGHNTAFRTRWMNDAVYHVASFMMIRNPVVWRWSHARHHSETIIVGRDPEIFAMRPPDLLRFILNIFGVLDTFNGLRNIVRNAAGVLDKQEATFVPRSEHRKIYAVARAWTLIYAAVIVLAIYLESILPFMLIGLPRIFGSWHGVICAFTQHTGLAEDVIDHRLNTRTIYINPVSRFIYWNMNYHLEHHLFPTVPYHALPKLHELIKHDLPAPNTSFYDALREILPVLKRQLHYEDCFLTRKLPPSAKPYRRELSEAPEAVAPAAA